MLHQSGIEHNQGVVQRRRILVNHRYSNFLQVGCFGRIGSTAKISPTEIQHALLEELCRKVIALAIVNTDLIDFCCHIQNLLMKEHITHLQCKIDGGVRSNLLLSQIFDNLFKRR